LHGAEVAAVAGAYNALPATLRRLPERPRAARLVVTMQRGRQVRHRIHAHEQAWLELARALAASGALDAGQLAQRLESHAARAPEVTGWFYGLLGLARGLHQASNDHSSLVQ